MVDIGYLDENTMCQWCEINYEQTVFILQAKEDLNSSSQSHQFSLLREYFLARNNLN